MWQGVLGFLGFGLLAWAVSERRRRVNWRLVAVGLVLQVVLAAVFLKAPFLNEVLLFLNRFVLAVEKATGAGATFMFGYLAGGDTPFELTKPFANFIVAFRVLPIVLVMSALSAVFFHWGLLQFLVRFSARILQRALRLSGALGFGVAANVYLGIVEAPLFIKPYLAKMSRSELFTVMSAGMATVAGTVMVLYASLLNPILPGAIGHILLASLLSAPAVVVIAQLLVPGEPLAEDGGEPVEAVQSAAQSSLDALVRGTMEGLQLLLNIVAMIIVLFALVSLLNQGLGLLPLEGVTVQSLLGYVFRPVVWMMGVPASEVTVAADLMGTKVALNEFVSYQQLAQLPAGTLSAKTNLILIYAMCGFANLASVGLLIGALGTLVPERRAEVVQMAFKALLAGVLATCTTGALVGILA